MIRELEPRRPGRLSLLRLVVPAIVLAASPGATAAAVDPAAPIFDPTGIRFGVETAGATWSLTVSGPDGYYERRVVHDAEPGLELTAEDGKPPTDGVYLWELRRLDAGSGAAPARVLSGAFRVVAGQTRAPRPSEHESPKDATGSLDDPVPPAHFNEDLTVAGRMCVGDECIMGEVMFTEAIKIKQNNGWIRVVDTSNEAGFSTRDWQLKFNDSFFNGFGYFAIEDRGDDGTASVSPFRIDAGAPANSIRVDATGRVGLGTSTPAAELQVAGDAIVDGDFTAGSSRAIKRDFEPVDPQAVLARLVELPVSKWSYRSQAPGIRHMGPVSEDFSAAFGLGRDERHVSPVDLSGVAFAAIQGLHQLLAERDAEIAELRRSRDLLSLRLAALEQIVAALPAATAKP